MNIRKFKISYLVLWGLGALASFILQFFFPAVVASGSIWGLAAGWQREIAFWNLGIVFIIVATLIKNKRAMLSAIILTATLLSLLFGLNHFFALIAKSRGWTHWLAFIANTVAFVVGTVILIAERRKNNRHLFTEQ